METACPVLLSSPEQRRRERALWRSIWRGNTTARSFLPTPGRLYKGFDLCSGKVTEEERKLVPHHLLDICDIGEKYSVFDYQKAAYDTIAQISERGRVPFLVGGTGLYIASVVQGYVFRQEAFDPDLRSELEAKSLDELWGNAARRRKSAFERLGQKEQAAYHTAIGKKQMGEERASRNQPLFSALQLGVTWPREILYRRIEKRLKMRLEQGMIEEVRRYLESGGPMERLCELGLEYRHIAWYLAENTLPLRNFRRVWPGRSRNLPSGKPPGSRRMMRYTGLIWRRMALRRLAGGSSHSCHKESRRKNAEAIALYGNKCPWP